LAANTDPILANVYRDGALLYENINLDINLDGLGANTVDVGGRSGTKNDEDWKIGDFIVWPEHEVSAALQGRPESPVLYFVDSVLELSETTSSAIPAVLTSAIDPGVGPVPLDWKQIRLEHEVGGGNMAKLYVNGQELVDAGVNITALYQGGGIRMTNVVVDDLRVYAYASSNTSTQDTETPTAACPTGHAMGIGNLERACGATHDQPCATDASSQLDVTNGDLTRINDGTTNANTFYTALDNPAWISIDLGEDRVVNSVKIYMATHTERFDNFKIFVGGHNANTDGTAPCHTESTNGFSDGDVVLRNCIGTGRYVFLQQSGSNHLTLYQMQVFGERDHRGHGWMAFGPAHSGIRLLLWYMRW
jgi:hypothetical protein